MVEVGDALTTLTESAGERTAEQLMSFDGIAGRQYLISAGLPTTQPFALSYYGAISFEWGPAPINDELATAGSLAGVSGTVIGSNRFATTGPGEATGLLGDSSVWWTWQAPESRWYRIALEGSERWWNRLGLQSAWRWRLVPRTGRGQPPAPGSDPRVPGRCRGSATPFGWAATVRGRATSSC